MRGRAPLPFHQGVADFTSKDLLIEQGLEAGWVLLPFNRMCSGHGGHGGGDTSVSGCMACRTDKLGKCQPVWLSVSGCIDRILVPVRALHSTDFHFRGQGLAAAWAWLKLAPRLPVLLEASTATCARLPPPALPSAGPSGALSVPLLCAACTCGLALTAFSSA